MGVACLVRAFSQSSGTCSEPKEYLEEAKKFSKPGLVAERKAYFEALYKRTAAKKAAALLEQENTSSNDLPEPNIVDEIESSKLYSHVVIDEMQGKEAPNTELVLSVDANVCDPNVEINKLQTNKVEQAEPTTEQLDIAENPIQVEVPNQHVYVDKHSKIMSTQREKMPIMDALNHGKLASTSKKRYRVVEIPVSKTSYFGNGKASNWRLDHWMLGSFVKLSPVPPSQASVYVLTVHPSATPPPDKRRSKALEACSVFGRTADAKSRSLLVDGLKSSGAYGHKARPLAVASSFSFKTEERAKKRKEYFQRLEEKLNAKETGKVHLQAKSKILLTQPRSPKFGRKPIPNMVQDNVSQPPWRL